MLWQIFVRDGEPKDYSRECYERGFLAVGWNLARDLSRFQSRDELERELEKKYPKELKKDPRYANRTAGTLWRFAREVGLGDLVLTPDFNSGCCYVGKIASEYYYQDEDKNTDSCWFLHRRNVKWLGTISPEEKKKIWKSGRIAGIQTVARIRSGEDKLRRLLARKEKRLLARKEKQEARPVGRLGGKPDPTWGKFAEERALEWLRNKDSSPKYVAHDNLGWDIECGDIKYEVKGRRSMKTAIRLTQNEYNMAQKYKDKYILLIFTADSLEALQQCDPEEITDPSNTCDWSERTVSEYVLNEC